MDVLVGDRGRRRAGLHEALPPGLRPVGLGGVLEVLGRPLLHHLHVVEQAALLVVPSLQGVAQEALTVLPGLGKGGVRAAVDPAGGALQHDELGGAPLQQDPVVAHHQDRAGAGPELILQPGPGGHVEVVVGLVEQEHVGPGVEQHVEHEPLALPARQLAHQAGRHVVDRALHTSLHRGGPLGLQLVAAEVAPDGEGLGVAHAVVGAFGHGPLGRHQGEAGGAQLGSGHLQQHLPQGVGGAGHPDVLGHRQHGAGDRGLAGVGLEDARQDPQDRALAHPVGPDDGGVIARRDPEAEVEEQRVPPRRGVLETGHDDAAHPASMPARLALRGGLWEPGPTGN